MMNQPNFPDPNAPAYPPDAETVPTLPQNESVRSANNDGVSVERQHESYVDQSGRQVESRVETYEDKNLRKENLRYWSQSVIYFLLGVLEVILALRFIFRLFGANENNDFILALYNFSHVFVGPFNNIFNDQAIGSKSVFELSTLVAMLIYALIAWGLVALARVLFAPSYGVGQNVAVSRRRWW
jgi:hypothetical protein